MKAPPLGSLCKNLTKRSPTEFLPTRELFQRVCAGQPQADSAKGPLWACTLDLRSVEIYPRSLLQRAYQNTSYRELADKSHKDMLPRDLLQGTYTESFSGGPLLEILYKDFL